MKRLLALAMTAALTAVAGIAPASAQSDAQIEMQIGQQEYQALQQKGEIIPNSPYYAILNPMTRGNIADYLLNSRICAAVNDWLLDRWLEPDTTNRFRGTIRVNPEDPKGAVAEIERLAAHPKLVQVGVPMQSREPYGKPMFEPIWEAAAARGLPVAVHINGGNGVDYPPTFAGHAHTYPGYAAFMPLNYFVHLATLIVECVEEPASRVIIADQRVTLIGLESLIREPCVQKVRIDHGAVEMGLPDEAGPPSQVDFVKGVLVGRTREGAEPRRGMSAPLQR